MRLHPAGSRSRHAVAGGILESDADLPGLPPAPRGGPSPSWVLRTVAPHDGAPLPGTALGTLTVAGGPRLALARDRDAHILDVSDTGRWTIRDGDVAFAPVADADPRAVALDVVGHVLPLLLLRTGDWPLHASAVATAHGALVFVGARGAGKSTLAAACVAEGAPLVGDDTTIVTFAPAPRLRPAGLPLRVRADVAAALALDGEDDGWGKRRIAAVHANAPLPIAAVLLVTPHADAPPACDDVAPRAAVAHLAASGKLAALLGPAHAGEALLQAARVVEAAPVRRLVVPRDLARVRDVARTLLATHGWRATP